ncbi:HAD family hydrolase [Streptomyces sp. AV19]|uniref:HAD family hydrolase n=1 Tax=Streptomyces sp. AV19 TaxID=2793068 RepID=UPI0018FE0E2C|nr:HAD family hydrolase [Streptomyces sp. AV19]MBH1935564.1 HAD family hydrolase [Streptomyces sp. AV19]MDG4534451.1 HAD hydrolase-like protein [Streptomyces sp. AV19]
MNHLSPHRFTVGFDLDLTLVDTRPAVRAAYAALAAATGAYIDVDVAAARVDHPLEQELRDWFPEDRVPGAREVCVADHPRHGITLSPAMPGAREAVGAVRALGGRVLVLTARHSRNARLHLDHLGIEPDVVEGSLWTGGRAVALRRYGAAVHVGDDVVDMRCARTAGALAVGVVSGFCAAEALRSAGAQVILPGLGHFPAWLHSYLTGPVRT